MTTKRTLPASLLKAMGGTQRYHSPLGGQQPQVKKVRKKDRHGGEIEITYADSAGVPPMGQSGAPPPIGGEYQPRIPSGQGQDHAQGNDAVPAWLTEGEFVMNSTATSLFPNEIETMNNIGRAAQRGEHPAQVPATELNDIQSVPPMKLNNGGIASGFYLDHNRRPTATPPPYYNSGGPIYANEGQGWWDTITGFLGGNGQDPNAGYANYTQQQFVDEANNPSAGVAPAGSEFPGLPSGATNPPGQPATPAFGNVAMDIIANTDGSKTPGYVGQGLNQPTVPPLDPNMFGETVNTIVPVLQDAVATNIVADQDPSSDAGILGSSSDTKVTNLQNLSVLAPLFEDAMSGQPSGSNIIQQDGWLVDTTTGEIVGNAPVEPMAANTFPDVPLGAATAATTTPAFEKPTGDTTQTDSSFKNPARFAELEKEARRAAAETGIDYRIIMAQAIQESGWDGKAPGNSYFGIKSHGQKGDNVEFGTHEFDSDGNRIDMIDSFRSYDSLADSVDGYANFLKTNPRYSDLLKGGTIDEQLKALQASGYATDPDYAKKLSSIIRGNTFKDLSNSNLNEDGYVNLTRSERQNIDLVRDLQRTDPESASALYNALPQAHKDIIDGTATAQPPNNYLDQIGTTPSRVEQDLVRKEEYLTNKLDGANTLEEFEGIQSRLAVVQQEKRNAQILAGQAERDKLRKQQAKADKDLAEAQRQADKAQGTGFQDKANARLDEAKAYSDSLNSEIEAVNNIVHAQPNTIADVETSADELDSDPNTPTLTGVDEGTDSSTVETPDGPVDKETVAFTDITTPEDKVTVKDIFVNALKDSLTMFGLPNTDDNSAYGSSILAAALRGVLLYTATRAVGYNHDSAMKWAGKTLFTDMQNTVNTKRQTLASKAYAEKYTAASLNEASRTLNFGKLVPLDGSISAASAYATRKPTQDLWAGGRQYPVWEGTDDKSYVQTPDGPRLLAAFQQTLSQGGVAFQKYDPDRHSYDGIKKNLTTELTARQEVLNRGLERGENFASFKPGVIAGKAAKWYTDKLAEFSEDRLVDPRELNIKVEEAALAFADRFTEAQKFGKPINEDGVIAELNGMLFGLRTGVPQNYVIGATGQAIEDMESLIDGNIQSNGKALEEDFSNEKYLKARKTQYANLKKAWAAYATDDKKREDWNVGIEGSTPFTNWVNALYTGNPQAVAIFNGSK